MALYQVSYLYLSLPLKIGRKEAHDTGELRPHLEKHLQGEGIFWGCTAGHSACVFYRDVNVSNGRLVYFDLQAENSGWLFKSPVAESGGILWQPHYRPHRLLIFAEKVLVGYWLVGHTGGALEDCAVVGQLVATTAAERVRVRGA